MSILRSLNTGVTGLRAAGSGMSVVGDNLANAGTFGFKASRAQFQDVLASSLKGIDGGDQIGAGTKLAHVTPVFSQGTIERTQSITDMAINGNGFFPLQSPFGRVFSRDGSFHFNKDGQLINGDDHLVLGFKADPEGKITNRVEPIQLGRTTIPAKATENVVISMNLDSREDIKVFDIKDPDKTSSYNNSLVVYDNVGTARLVNVYFNKSAEGVWDYHVLIDGSEAAGGIEGEFVEMATGQLKFNNKGVLDEEVESLNSFNFNKGAAPDQKIAFDFGETIKEGGDGTEAITQYGSPSSIDKHTQDGASAATIAGLSFNDSGILSANYTNGETRNLAQVAIAKFENNEGLFKLGRNLFKESRKSGQAALDKPGASGRGQVRAKSIELSNVDMAEEFLKLMASQRNFTASSKTITTANEMLQEVLNIKR